MKIKKTYSREFSFKNYENNSFHFTDYKCKCGSILINTDYDNFVCPNCTKKRKSNVIKIIK